MQFGLVGVFTCFRRIIILRFLGSNAYPNLVHRWTLGRRRKRIKVTTKFFVYTFVGSLFMFIGLIYVYNHAASFELTDLYNANLNEVQQVVVFWLIFLAFAVKLPIFHFTIGNQIRTPSLLLKERCCFLVSCLKWRFMVF